MFVEEMFMVGNCPMSLQINTLMALPLFMSLVEFGADEKDRMKPLFTPVSMGMILTLTLMVMLSPLKSLAVLEHTELGRPMHDGVISFLQTMLVSSSPFVYAFVIER